MSKEMNISTRKRDVSQHKLCAFAAYLDPLKIKLDSNVALTEQKLLERIK